MTLRIILIAAAVIAIAVVATAVIAMDTLTASLDSGVNTAAHSVGAIMKNMSAPTN